MADQTKSKPEPIKIPKVYKYFDLSTFEEKKEEVEVTFTPAGDFSEATQRFDNDESKILSALNAALQRAVLKSAKKEIVSKGASKKVVLDLIRPMRNMSPWSLITMKNENGETVPDRKAQTKALLDLVKSTPALVDSVRATSLAQAESDDDEDGQENEE